MPQFTREQWNEIYAVRERLAQYKNKVQPYPAYPEPQEEVPQPQEVIHWHSSMGRQEHDLLEQLKLKSDWLEKELKKRKPRGQY